MNKLYLLTFIPIITFTAQIGMAQTIKNDPPALEDKNSMPNTTYTSKYLGPQIVVTSDSVRLTQGYDKKSKKHSKKNSKSSVEQDKGHIEPIEKSDVDVK